MKIALVFERYRPNGGGSERSTEQIARRLIARGHQVSLLTSRTFDGTPPEGLRVIASDRHRTSTARGLNGFRRWVDAQLDDYDTSLSVTTAVAAGVILLHGGTVKETLLRNASRRPGSLNRAFQNLLVRISPKKQAMLRAERETYTHRRLKTIVSISHYVTRQLKEHFNTPDSQIALIPNVSPMTPPSEADIAALRQSTRAHWNISEHDTAFLFSAMNPGLKGLDDLIHAMPRVVAQHPQTVWLLTGKQTQHHRNLAAKLNVDPHIRWVGSTREMASFYAATDVTVLPTWYDPASNVVLESLKFGVPAISTSFNGASQWILDPANGTNTTPAPDAIAGRVIDTPRDTAALAQAMIDLCDANTRTTCATAARKLNPALDMDHHVEALEKVLLESAGAGGDQP